MPAESLNGNNQLTEEEYKQLCLKVRHHQASKNKGKKRSKPLLKPIGTTVAVTKTLSVAQNPVDWDELATGALFSLEPAGVVLYSKAGASRAICLSNQATMSVSGGACYRVFL